VDIATIQKYIEIDPARQNRIMSQYMYYSGRHTGIYYDNPKEDPDNRVPVPIVRKAIQFILGYMFKPGNITYTGPYYDSTLKDIYDANEEELLNAEHAKTALIAGYSYEAHWTEDGQERFARVPAEQGIMVKSDDIVPRDIAFIRHWIDIDRIHHVWVYDDSKVTIYSGNGGALVFEKEYDHGYKSVPVLEIPISDDLSNLFDHVLPLVDLMDKGLSEDIANEMQRLANSYLLMANDIDSTTKDDNGETDVDKIKRTKIFSNLRDDVTRSVAFLTKNLNPEFINTALDRIERLIYDMIGVPNPGDETFANAVSGTALAYRLLPFEYLCASIEVYFTRFLQRRIRLIGALDSTINGTDSAVADIDIKWARNLPMNHTEMIENAVKLSAILSKRSVLEYLPSDIVPDVENELKEQEEESQGIADMIDVANSAENSDMPQEGEAEDIPTGA
jgi:SPP1 family phage portal protein